ncbi:MAG: glutaredoxin domain-containing protein [Bacillota bacterium]
MKVFLYALSTCYYCRQAKKFLDDNKVAYDFVNVDLTEGDEKKKLVD